MGQGFDPYYKWLGIPPKDQPADHYRLLGLSQFESDLQVIEAAADRQMTFVRTFQNGPHSERSQQLLNELAAAKVTLLRPEKRAIYNAALREQLVAKQQPAVPPPSPPPSPPLPGPVNTPALISHASRFAPAPQTQLTGPTAQPLAVAELGATGSAEAHRAANASSKWFLLLIVCVTALVGSGVFLWLFDEIEANVAQQSEPTSSRDEATPAATSATVENPNAEKPNDQTTGETNAKPVPAAINIDKPAVAAKPAIDRREVIELPSIATERMEPSEKIDLLNWVSPKRDTLTGNWQLVDGQLQVALATQSGGIPVAGGSPLIQLPRVPQREIYRLKIEATRTAGTGSLFVILPHDGKPHALQFDGVGHRFCWPIEGDKNAWSMRAWEFPDNKSASLTLLVSERIWIVPKAVSIFQFPINQALVWKGVVGSRPDAICLGAHNAAFQIHRLEYTEYETVLTAGPPSLETPAAKSIAPLRSDDPPLDPPAEESLARAFRHVDDCHARFFKQATSLEESTVVTRCMILQSREGARNAVEAYALLRRAAQYASELGDVVLAVRAIDDLAVLYQIDFEQDMAAVLKVAVVNCKQNTQRAEAIEFLSSQATAAKGLNQPTAEKLYREAAIELARAAGDLRTLEKLAEPPVAANEAPKRRAAPAVRAAVPGDAQRAISLGEIQRRFANNYEQAKGNGVAFCLFLRDQANEDSYGVAERYVLHEESIRLALQWGQWSVALSEIDRLGEEYQVDAYVRKIATIHRVQERVLDKSAREALIKALREQVALAIEKEQFNEAYEWHRECLGAAKNLSNAIEVARELRTQARDILVLIELHNGFVAAEKALKTSPGERSANVTKARYLCFIRGDWALGLNILALQGDSQLRQAAQMELSTSETSNVASLLALADGWYLLGETSTASTMVERNAMRRRASYWYELAIPNLENNDRIRAVQRSSKYPFKAKQADDVLQNLAEPDSEKAGK